jgi:signal transduction histidine kinase
MIISLLFSFTIFETTSSEVNTRLGRLQNTLRMTPGFMTDPNDALVSVESDKASSHIVMNLIYANTIIFFGGGMASYLLARRTLRPIEEAHEAQKRFTSDASHELRTPLAAMKTELEVTLRDKNATKQELEEVLTSNLEEVDKLTNLSEMLLNLSRLDHDKLERAAIDMQDITQEVISLYSKTEPRIELKVTSHPLIEGNESALTELVSVLVNNALKYSPAGSTVKVTISSHNRQLLFKIRNSGPGISEDALPHIFERFYRADESRAKHVHKGYGLGLALAKRIVELHHGELTVTSTPDESTVFTVGLTSIQKSPSKS